MIMTNLEMIRDTEEILHHLEYAKLKADTFIDELPGSIDKKLLCALWYERFSDILMRRKKDKIKNFIFNTIKKVIEYVTLFRPQFKKNRKFKNDFVFIFGSAVHRMIVKELIAKLRDYGFSIVEYEDYNLNIYEKFKYMIIGIKHIQLKKSDILLLSPNLFFSLLFFCGLLSHYRPKITICFNETTPKAGLLSHVCEMTHSKSVNIAHAISAKTPLRQNSPFDYHIVYGEKSKKNIIENNGIVDGEIVSLGALKMDKYFKDTKSKKQRYIKNIDKNSEKKLLIVGSWKGHFLDDTLDHMYTFLSEFAQNHPDLSFIYKPHPLEVGSRNAYSLKFSQLKNCTIIPPESNLLKTIDSVDIVLLGWSAVGLEAAIRKKPVIVVNPCNVPDWLSYIESEYGLEIKSFRELESAIKEIYRDYDYYCRKAEEFVELHLENKGKACEEIYTFLIKILDYTVINVKE